MRDTISMCVAVLPNGKEHFGTNVRDLEQFGKDAVHAIGIKSPRKNPIKVKMQIYAITVKNGECIRSLIRSVEVQPYLESMTLSEYKQEMKEILEDIPKEFHKFVESDSVDHGSSNEEIIEHAQSLISNLKPCIDELLRNYAKGTEAILVHTLNVQAKADKAAHALGYK